MPHIRPLPSAWPVAVATAMALLTLLALPAHSALAHGGHGGQYAHDHGGGVRIETADIGVLVANDELGIHGEFLAGGISEFSFGVDTTIFRQARGSGNESYHNTRVIVGFDFVEFFAGWHLRIELGLHIGDHLVGDDSFTDFGLGLDFAMPIFLDEEGHPYWQFDFNWSFAQPGDIDENFQLYSTTSVFPFPEPVRNLGIEAGWLWGESRNIPFGAAFIGLVWTAKIG